MTPVNFRDSLELQRHLIKRKLEILKDKRELEQNNNNIDNLTDVTNTSTKLSSGKNLTKTKRTLLSRSFTGFDKQSPKQHRWSTELEDDETSMQIRHSRLSLSRSLTHGDILANGDTSRSVYARNGSRVTSSQSECKFKSTFVPDVLLPDTCDGMTASRLSLFQMKSSNPSP